MVVRMWRAAASVIILGVIIGLTPGITNEARAQIAETGLTAEAFLRNPTVLLQQNPVGGSHMANVVEQLALGDPSTFGPIIGLLPQANDAQKTAIGQGLAQATKLEVLTDQSLAENWQEQIAAIDDKTFKLAATDAFGDVQLGAVGGGNLGGGGGGPSVPSGFSSGPRDDSPPKPVPTHQFTYSPSTSSGPGWSFTEVTSRSSTPPSTPVSP